MELHGIENENGYFPEGFLAEGLEGEIADAKRRWSEAAAISPVDRIDGVGGDWLKKLQFYRTTNDKNAKGLARAELSRCLVEALGFDYRRQGRDLNDGSGNLVPTLGQVQGPDGRDLVWIIEAADAADDQGADPLSLRFKSEQLVGEEAEIIEGSRALEDLLGDAIFALEHAPRFVIVVGMSQLVVVRRNKWPERSVLRFDLIQIFDRDDSDTLSALACFASREAIAPLTGTSVVDRMEEEAQRKANAVTSSLKSTVRDAIEILGQEVLAVTGGKYPADHPRSGTWIRGEDLTPECLRYMYRLLFLFYAEANPRLDVLDMKNPVYASGYSLEALRAYESRRLTTQAEREGTFLWQSLQKLLELINEGTGGLQHKSRFELKAARVHLLDPRSTPILSSIRLRNAAVQEIIRKLSLKQTKGGTGRISYAQLGIGQLGAVYETLISFTGFVAKEDLIEIRPSKKSDAKEATDEDLEEDQELELGFDDIEDELDYQGPTGGGIQLRAQDLLGPSWFVPRTRAKEFPVEQVIYDGNEPRIYAKGTFVYRLAGRDREKTAAYYTPEPLARLLVKHTLMERCKDLPADELLKLTILEPAMGSAAFLVETVNQLADLYLERKQAETAQTIPQADYFLERQKVRAYLSDRNCFGVDLNPIAMELGAISLWLNSLHAGEFSPYFGDQLHAGNSLIGARRATYPASSLQAKGKDSWMKSKPTEVGWRGTRDVDHVWQFLLPAPGMCNFEGEKTIKAFAGEAQTKIKEWRKGGWEQPFTDIELALVKKLSVVVDGLFDAVADDLAKSRELSNDGIVLWPDVEIKGATGKDFVDKRHQVLVTRGEAHLGDTVPYRRLKAAMDAWCALWLWPLDKADLLPDRRKFLMDLRMILEGGFLDSEALPEPVSAENQLDIFEKGEAEELASQLPSAQSSLSFNPTDVDALIADEPWLAVADQVAAREGFVHYDLIFADILRERGGFDIIVGNPPWARPGWNEGAVLADIDPIHAGLSATQAKNVLAKALANATDQVVEGQRASAETAFLREYASTRGAMSVTSSSVMNPFAGGGANNLYRCFIDLSFRLMAEQGNTGLIHQDGHLGDPKSGPFRREWYKRIAKHFDHSNQIMSKNFAEVANHVRFSSNIYRGAPSQIGFDQFTFACLPSQVEDSYLHDGSGLNTGIKNDDGNWNTIGHRDRIIRIDLDSLKVIHSLSEEEDVPVKEARFIQPFSTQMLDLFKQLAKAPKLGTALAPGADGLPKWQMGHDWNETTSRNDGTIERVTGFHDPDHAVLQGPLFHVGNPLYKTPRSICNTNRSFDPIDLTAIPDDYVPRTNYQPAVDFVTYRSRMTKCSWDPTKNHTDFYRVAFRAMINLNSERSLIGALIPRNAAHINGVQSIAWSNFGATLNAAALYVSLIADFTIKASGKTNFHDKDAQGLPWVWLGPTAKHRALRLSSLTSEYLDLWNSEASKLQPAGWSLEDSRLALEGLIEGPKFWDRTAALRTDFARRLALVEIDVLVAQALGLTLDQLIEIYRIYFPVLQENEAGTWYDQRGRIVWTCSKGLPGVGYLERTKKGVWKSPGRSTWEKILASNPPELSCEAIDDTLPGGPRTVTRHFVGPFTKSDRVEDYKRAWAHFERLRAEGVEV